MKRGLFFLLVAAMFTAFAWQSQLASFGDDSASYLTLAHYFSPWGDPAVSRWAGWHSNFPPLFPLALALSGAPSNLAIGFALVALFAAGGVFLFQRYAAAELGERGAFAVTIVFLCTATAWISLKGLLSESLFLLVSMAALRFYQSRLFAREANTYEWLAFGVLLACAPLTRAIGILLVVAFALHLVIRFAKRDRPPRAAWLALLPTVVLLGLWYAVRPRAPIDFYQFAVSWVVNSWLENPLVTALGAWRMFFDSWIGLFLADSEVAFGAKGVLAAIGVVAAVGVVMRVMRNRFDGWFALLSVGVIFVWTFGPQTTRRLMYPLLPLLLLFAADAVRQLLDALRLVERRRLYAAAAITAMPILLCLPALVAIGEKSLDRRAAIAGCPQTFREITPYYNTVNLEGAEGLARLEVIMLCGLQSLDKVTPPGSVVMWTRPEYVALLAKRPAVPYYYRWTPRELATAIKSGNADYLVITILNKNDLEGGLPKPTKGMQEEAYSQPVFASTDEILVVKKIDKAALERFLEGTR